MKNKSNSVLTNPFNISTAFTTPPDQLDFVLPGFLAGTVGALVSPGGTGKSFFALEAAMEIACSAVKGVLLNLSPKQHGRVVYLAGEDPGTALHGRIHAMGENLSSEARADIQSNLTLYPTMGSMFNIGNKFHLEELIKVATGARLLVLDTLSRIHHADENSNGAMAQVISTLENVAVKTGAAVLFLHHVNKGSTKDGSADTQQASRGASSLIDNARWCGFLSTMPEKDGARFMEQNGRHPVGNKNKHYVRFGVSKLNYCAPVDDRWFVRGHGGVLFPVELETYSKRSANSRDFED